MPTAARVHLAHAVVQHLAGTAGVELLHLKGPAVSDGLRDPLRTSSDVDVLVRPSHLARLIHVLEAHGWERRTDFATGSPFAHAANWWHDNWGWVDVHVAWPGARIPAETVFDTLAAPRSTKAIAHVECPVPDRTGQRLVLLLHAARSPGTSDKDWAWDRATDDEKAAVRALAAELDAQVALAGALGELHLHTDDPDHQLWLHFSEGNGDRISEWRARLSATRGTRARLRLALDLARVNRDHLRLELGREPTRGDVRRRQRERLRRATDDLRSRLR
ncbi:MAG: nucleotidyltransferase family protein [Nocardioides sp.]|uniref:nucleotidyltransferase family protein n=1 Tax=Nocardioides sp. TaxID=35761 RepID=UPI003263E9CC